jgi:hypothetical protein
MSRQTFEIISEDRLVQDLSRTENLTYQDFISKQTFGIISEDLLVHSIIQETDKKSYIISRCSFFKIQPTLITVLTRQKQREKAVELRGV